jgi:AraC family transcriptional regulator, regulatory protein of adaptative response / methylated-DNA-[protein]-cysteine methyltransferase
MSVVKARPNAAQRFQTDDERWNAVMRRDPTADGAFFYSVKTTGVYCRPRCAARLAKRENVRFHATAKDAERAGFRACKRCRPREASTGAAHAAAVARACQLIDQAGETPGLEALAKSVGLSASHFHRVFKALTGLTPKAYATAQRSQRVRGALLDSKTVTDAVYKAGFKSNGRFYATAPSMLGMRPVAFRAGGDGAFIRFAVGQSTLGAILVAASEKGVCSIALGDDPNALVKELQDRFPKAELVGGDARFEKWVAKVVGLVERPSAGLNLPLDVQGTAFQQRVWHLLRKIPCGETTTYAEIARRLGEPTAVRAVAGAIAANPIAVAIPCHRVVRTDGSLSGYRWGVERKAQLLERERKGS